MAYLEAQQAMPRATLIGLRALLQRMVAENAPLRPRHAEVATMAVRVLLLTLHDWQKWTI